MRQVLLDGKDVGINLAQFAQRAGQVQQVLAVRAARAAGAGDLARNVQLRGGAKEGRVFLVGDVDQAFCRAAIVKADGGGQAQIAILFAVVQVGEYLAA